MNPRTAEVLRITASMTVACALGALVLGAIQVGTDRYTRAARAAEERAAVTRLLDLDAGARVREIGQYFDRPRGTVIYRTASTAGRAERLVFSLDGRLLRRDDVADRQTESRGLDRLGRIFVAERDHAIRGFVVEGETRGYKNVIRFFVALDSAFTLTGVEVIQHEEDPGLGAEVATPWFEGQFAGRSAGDVAALDVTRDPVPEDWGQALARLEREPMAQWRAQYHGLVERERTRPIHAVTGATISSRALTDGVRATVDHFRRRWRLLEPMLGGAS
jgi:electron transport complex protein RnfG